jgi:hypothetical protein
LGLCFVTSGSGRCSGRECDQDQEPEAHIGTPRSGASLDARRVPLA